MFNKESYYRHSTWYNQKFSTETAKIAYLKKNKSGSETSIGAWLQGLFFNCLDPLLKTEGQAWLTVGDAYGFDAQYILKKGNRATASDLNTDFLRLAKEEGIITDFSAQNAEHLSYPDLHFDYVLCKESYHHFPRPYAALYEMIRVARKGIVLIEPQDPVSRMPLLLGLVNLLAIGGSNLPAKLWKNRFSYEPVGNFVYKISERELEKFTAGLNLPLIAFKKINPNFYFAGANEIEVSLKNSRFRQIWLKKRLFDGLVKIGLMPSQVLSAVVFKELPAESTLTELKKSGYQLVYISPNPYL